MDQTKVHRIGNRPYRSNFMPSSNTRQAIGERLHGRGISTSSNSSWTFSNSHSDIPKPKKGRLWGIFLIGAIFVVVLAVLAIGGLAFYMGAMRIEAGRQDLIFDGSLRITYGDQYQTTLSNHSNKNFQEKANRYSQMLTSVFQKSAVGASLHEINILKFENGSLIVHFRINLDRRKIPSSIVAVEDVLKNILIEEISSVKPIAFRNLQVDKNNLFIKRFLGEESNPEHRVADRTEVKAQTTTKKIEIKNGVVRKVSTVTTSSTTEESQTYEGKIENESTILPDDPIIEISETVQNFSETLKTQIPEIIHTDIKSIDFNEDVHNKTKVYQSVYVTSDNFEIKNGTRKKDNKDDVIEGSYKVTKLEGGSIINDERKETNGHAKPVTSTTTEFFVPEYSDEPWRPIIPSANPEPVEFRDAYVDIYDAIISDDHIEDATEEIIEEEKPITFSKETYEQNIGIAPGFIGKVKIDSIKNNKLSRITEDLAKKYKDLLKNHRLNEEDVLGVAETVEEIKTEETSTINVTEEIVTKEEPIKEVKSPLGLDQMILGIRQVEDVSEATTKSTTETAKITTEATKTTTTATNLTTTEELVTKPKEDVNITVKNPFVEMDDSRSSSGFNFGIPDFPILKQFHHLDSLLKSFSSKSAGSELTPETATRFPARTKATTDRNYRNEDKIYIAVSTISPEDSTRQKTSTTTTTTATHTTTTSTTTAKPVVIKGEVEVLDEDNKKNITFDKIPSITTTEVPKLITLLPVRSNVNMKRPLRPRPKPKSGESSRKSKMNSEFRKMSSKYIRNQTENVLYSIPYTSHHFVDDKDGKRWIYYSSSKLATSPPNKNEKLFIVTPEPKTPAPEETKEMIKISENSKSFSKNLTKIPIYNTIETLLNADHRERETLRNRTKNSTLNDKNRENNKNASEIIDKIVKIMENVAISTGNTTKVIVKVNQTVLSQNVTNVNTKAEESNSTDIGISTKAVSSNYKVNQAGVPVLTKVLNKAPVYTQNMQNTSDAVIYKNGFNESLLYSYLIKDCDNNSVRCGNGVCLPASTRCNQLVDCPDAADEKNCTCSEHLKAQHLHRKLCDGIVDCWDFTDEYNCEWCKEKEYLCSNSRMCITKSQICDGVNHCPFGDDERYCVTVSPSKIEANSFNYHSNGYLMVRKHGNWGKLCIDNFENVSMESKTGWKISDLGRSVCKALTFRDFDKVERMISVPNEGRSMDGTLEPERYYELSYNNLAEAETYSRDSLLTFHETECRKKEVIKVTCTDLECGLRPKAVSQVWSRIVGGGNANPGAWPWQAALYKEGEFQCGATLISPQWLVSAGHCFYHNQDEYWVARLGTLRTTSSLPSPYEQLRQISKIILHPQYIDTGFINDISLLKMSDPVSFTDYVRPICLPKPNTKIIDGMMCTVVGWGQLFEIGRIFPDTLQEVQLPVISSSECQKRTLFLTLYKVTDDMFCAGYERGGRDACLGDSGGPLMCQESDGKWSLYGVTSNGYGCARSNRPGVYTKVSRYLHWIHAQMNLHAEDEAISQNDYKYESNHNDYAHYNVSKIYNSTDKQQADVIIKLISEKIPNVKFATSDGIKARDKCKGHRCPLGECLPKSRLCNGYIECSDGSDEKDCW